MIRHDRVINFVLDNIQSPFEKALDAPDFLMLCKMRTSSFVWRNTGALSCANSA